MFYVDITNKRPWDLTSDQALNNAQEIYDFFIDKGYTEEAAAGIIGNMAVESYLNPGQIGHGYKVYNRYSPRGFIMWTSSPNIDSLYRVLGYDQWHNGYLQLEYIQYNPNNLVFCPNPDMGYNYSWVEYSQLTDLEEAVKAFCWEAERPKPASAHINLRIKYAMYYLNVVKEV